MLKRIVMTHKSWNAPGSKISTMGTVSEQMSNGKDLAESQIAHSMSEQRASSLEFSARTFAPIVYDVMITDLC